MMSRLYELRSFIAATLIIVSAGAYYAFAPDMSAEAAAHRIIESCASAKDKPVCYETAVPALYPARPVPHLFDIVRDIRAQDPSYRFCHVLAHEIGEAVVEGNPEAWVEAIALNPKDGMCSNGFIHGVIGGRFRAEVLDEATVEQHLPDFSRACEPRANWRPSPLDQAICYHGTGHLYTFITDAALPQALSLCERTAMSPTGDFRRVCREGVFMQIFQPLEPDDFFLIERLPVTPTKENARSLCRSYGDTPENEGACLRESWPFFRKEILSGTGIAAFCAGHPNAKETDNCYESLFSILGRQSLGKPEQVLAACGGVPEERKGMCYSYSARAVLEEDRNDSVEAVGLCLAAPSAYTDSCLKPLVNSASFMFGEDKGQYRKFCDSLPSSYRSECRPQ